MSLNDTKARASVPSGLRYLARFSSSTRGATDTGRTTLAGFFGEEEKKLRMPPLEAGAAGGRGGGGGAGVLALNWETICGSRRIFRVRVNSSLLCSMLTNPGLIKWRNRRKTCSQFKFLLDLTVLLQVTLRGCHKMNPIIERAGYESSFLGERQIKTLRTDHCRRTRVRCERPDDRTAHP